MDRLTDNEKNKVAGTEAKSCCCSDKNESKPVKTEEHACCGGEKEKKTVAPAEKKDSCCCGKNENKTVKTEEKVSCCGKNESKPLVTTEKKDSCCCPGKNTPEIKKPDKIGHSAGGCCGDTHQGGGCCDIGSAKNKNSFWVKFGKYIFLGISLLSLVASFILGREGISEKLPEIMHYLDFGLIAVALCGFPLFKKAAKKLVYGKGFSGKVTSALLVSIAMTACITLQILLLSGVIGGGDGHNHSYIFAAGEIAFLMYLGGVIEDFTTGKARAGIERLVRLKPTTAKYYINGVIVEKPLSEVRVGDRVTVLPDDMISVDGVIVEGITTADESIITGEATPVEKAPGDAVFGGTFNGGGAITVEVTKAEDEMTVSKLRRLVEEAEGRKAPISRLAEKAASFIVPSSIIIAFLVFFVNFIFRGTGIFAPTAIDAVERGVTILVTLCPCALGLATPVAVAAGLGNAAKNGILIKSGEALEQFGRVKTVAFDKTGTLTQSAIQVDKVIGCGKSEEYVLRKAAAAESLSGHPLARAIAAKFPEEKAESVTAITGLGVSAVLNGAEITVKKWAGCEDGDLSAAATGLLNQGKTVVEVRENNILIGLIALSDKLREGSRTAVAALKRDGIRAVMLTGDNAMAANYMAKQAGIDPENVRAALLPEDKLEEISRLKTVYKTGGAAGGVCMVGDGVNDAPALALADVSLAMGALGSDAAIETASAALMSSDIKKVPGCLSLGRKVLRTIKVNICISMGINVLSVVLSLIGVLNPVWGALVHNLSSVLVALNSALLLGTKYKIKE